MRRTLILARHLRGGNRRAGARDLLGLRDRFARVVAELLNGGHDGSGQAPRPWSSRSSRLSPNTRPRSFSRRQRAQFRPCLLDGGEAQRAAVHIQRTRCRRVEVWRSPAYALPHSGKSHETNNYRSRPSRVADEFLSSVDVPAPVLRLDAARGKRGLQTLRCGLLLSTRPGASVGWLDVSSLPRTGRCGFVGGFCDGLWFKWW